MSKRVLVADDSKFNIALLNDILQKEGYAVTSVSNGADVLSNVLSFKPDIILLDIVMPDLDGFTVCSELKRNDDTKNIPVIMVTAKTQGKDIKRALEIGAFDYIKKPVDETEVIARVQSALRYKEYQDKLQEMAMKDGLTGLYNHALLLELFSKEYCKQQRRGGDISFVMLDLDYFKKVNDTYGHLKGNDVLKGVSNVLAQSIRECDIAGRYGGEEFAIILPEIKRDKVIAICERIRRRIALTPFFIDDGTINVSVSIGVCFKSSESTTTTGDMIQLADEALYEAKHNGRNNVKIRDILIQKP